MEIKCKGIRWLGYAQWMEDDRKVNWMLNGKPVEEDTSKMNRETDEKLARAARLYNVIEKNFLIQKILKNIKMEVAREVIRSSTVYEFSRKSQILTEKLKARINTMVTDL